MSDTTHFALMWIAGVTVWHLATLNSLTLISGRWAETRWFVPKTIVLSKLHLLGVLLAALGSAFIILSAGSNRLNYGIFAGGALIIADGYLIYRAVKQRPR